MDLSPLKTDYTREGMPVTTGIYGMMESKRKLGGDVDSNLLSAACHLSALWHISSSPGNQ